MESLGKQKRRPLLAAFWSVVNLHSVAEALHPNRHTHEAVSRDVELAAFLTFGEKNHPFRRNSVIEHQSKLSNLVVPHKADQPRLNIILRRVDNNQRL